MGSILAIQIDVDKLNFFEVLNEEVNAAAEPTAPLDCDHIRGAYPNTTEFTNVVDIPREKTLTEKIRP